MDAEIVTSKRKEPIEEMMKKSHCRLVEEDEIVTEIRIPASTKEYRVGYDKFRVRDSHDFAVVSVASAYKMQEGVLPICPDCTGRRSSDPLRARGEAYITGKQSQRNWAPKQRRSPFQSTAAFYGTVIKFK